MSSDPAAGSLIQRLKRKFNNQDPQNIEEQLKQEAASLHQKKAISEMEYSMIEGIINFHGKMAREVMVPRPDAFMVNAKHDFQQNLDDILRQPYSRIPVYAGSKDKIIGVIHIRTVLRKAREVGFSHLTYDQVMFKPLFVRETIELDELLVEMQQTQQQLAILTDEFGGVVGLVTIEDLIEEIVGAIDDEVDQAEVLCKKISSTQYVVYGKMTLDEFNEQFDTKIEEDGVDTIAGYMITKLGAIPAKGEKLSVSIERGMKLTTRRMKGARLLTVLLTIPSESKKEKMTD